MTYDHYKTTNPDDETLGDAMQGYTLTDRLESVRPRRLNLSVDGGGYNRPDLTIWPAVDEDIPPAVVTLKVGALHGQQLRYVDMTVAEARALAGHLREAADLIEHNVLGTNPLPLRGG